MNFDGLFKKLLIHEHLSDETFSFDSDGKYADRHSLTPDDFPSDDDLAPEQLRACN